MFTDSDRNHDRNEWSTTPRHRNVCLRRCSIHWNFTHFCCAYTHIWHWHL